MRKKDDIMQYFSGSAVTRLPLYKVLAGGLAAVMVASLGLGAMAAGVAGALPAPTPAPTPTAAPTPEPTPVPTPTPTPTPAPIEILLETTVVQQDIGMQLSYIDPDAEPAVGDTDEDAGHLPLTGVESTVVLADAEGETTEYSVDTATGTVLAEDVEPGDYTVSVAPLEGYILPAPQSVTVGKKVEYKADVEAVKKEIKQASQVTESAEDSGFGNGGSAPIAEETTDTVPFAESAKVEVGRQTVYTPKLNGEGYLLLKDGKATAYKPNYDGSGVLTGASRSGAAPAAYRGTGNGSLVLPLAAGGRAHAHDGTDLSASPEPTAAPTATPAPEATPTPEATPAPTPAPDPTPAPEATPAPATPAPKDPAAPKDPTAGWPQTIAAGELEKYGFDVSREEKVQYEYTGWQEIDGSTYYYHPETHEPVTGSQIIQGVLYEFGADGALNRTSRGIDVSKYQLNIDWNAVKADGIDWAIIRVGYRGYGSGALVEDSAYRRNIQGAIAAGLRVGVYFYSQAVNEEEAVQEASMVLSLVGGYSLPMGVWYDTEKVAGAAGRADAISAAERTACAVAFCETIRNSGYTPGVYSYASWFYNNMNFANISKYRIWVAQYRDTLDFKYGYQIWQYTGSGHVNGVPTEVDMNVG